MHIDIKGHKWAVLFCPLKEIPMKKGETLLGLCDYDNKTIFIADSTHGEERLATLVHEMLHAIDEGLTEKRVKDLSTGVAKALWKLGYRRIEN
jgi:MinD superfamily P-loop ATPase